MINSKHVIASGCSWVWGGGNFYNTASKKNYEMWFDVCAHVDSVQKKVETHRGGKHWGRKENSCSSRKNKIDACIWIYRDEYES